MIEFELCGIGTWCERFSGTQQLIRGLETGQWPDTVALQPELIPPRERRRAPGFVRMAVEVMDQACRMAQTEPRDAAVVFASRMSDMETTDAICRALAGSPRLVSPTRFHNSVHNAATGYWSIATGSRMPANAIAAYETSPSVALLEAAAQLHVERVPVLAVIQDASPPPPFRSVYEASPPFAAALLLMPCGMATRTIAHCRLELSPGEAAWPDWPAGFPPDLRENTSARIIPLLCATLQPTPEPRILQFPVAEQSTLSLSIRAVFP